VKSYRAWSPDQPYLLPPAPREWLPAGHLAFFVLDLVRDLDLGAIEAKLQAKESRGERPYSPVMMTALLLYAYATSVFSSRGIERATVEDVAFRFLAANEHPHFTTINQFRARHRKALAELFTQVLQACMSAGLVKLGHVALDGTKMKANASKHKAMSYDRLVADDAKLRAEVEGLLERAEQVDAEEDEREGAYDPQEEIRRREERLAKMQEAREALRRETAAARARRLREQAEELRKKATDPDTLLRDQSRFPTLAGKRDEQAARLEERSKDASNEVPDDNDDDDLPRSTPPSTHSGEPQPKAQRNFTDPQSRLMFRDGAFLQAYNGQLAVDEANQIIVAAGLSNQGADNEYFGPMLRRVVDNCGAVPACTTGDSGYFSAANVHLAERMGTLPVISVGKHHNSGLPREAETTLLSHQLNPERAAMRAFLESPEGRALYARRKATVEPVIGQIRTRGFQQLSFRGLFKNRCEWLFVAATHNLLKLWRAVSRRRLQLAAA
jgi:transposase